jgi:hypothetical protein
MECWPRILPFHLKISAWHNNQRRLGQAPRLELGELKALLVPRQALLKRLDTTGELSVPTVRTHLEPLVRQYYRLVIQVQFQDRVDDGTHLRDALKIYNYFHQLNRAHEWEEIALSCTCRVCFGNCVSKHTLLFVSLFKQDVHVPDSWNGPGSLLHPFSGKSASPSRELPGAGDVDSLSSASATKRASTQRSRSCRAQHRPPFRYVGGIRALQKSSESVSLPRSCRPLHRSSLAMMTFRLRYV